MGDNRVSTEFAMRQSVSFVIPGKIGGKGRPRFSRKSGRAYTPAKTASDEATVKHFAAQAMLNRKPLQGPVSLDIRVYRNRPASWPTKRKAETLWITGKPDTSNSQKLIEDAMNGIVYCDDAQISMHHMERMYRDFEQERIEVIVTPLSNNQPRFGISYSSDAHSPSLSARNTK